MNNKEIIKKFYSAFSEGNVNGMLECYHKDVTFQDAVFGKLSGERAFYMWRMLLSQKKRDTTVIFDKIGANDENGKASWVARYVYGEKKRKVVYCVNAEFKFKDGKIIEHLDKFDLWAWTKQALGFPGHLLGWTSFMRKKIQKSANKNLDDFINKNRY